MTEHPITPPHELVQQWLREKPQSEYAHTYIATKAARWAADQELEACCEWVSQWCGRWSDGSRPEDGLRTARRPKPPSLKEQALARTDAILNDPNRGLLTEVRETLKLNRRALEALPE